MKLYPYISHYKLLVVEEEVYLIAYKQPLHMDTYWE